MIDIFGILASAGQADAASVEAFLYQDGNQVEHYAAPVVVLCFREGRRRLVLDAANGKGAQIVSGTTVYLPIGTVCPTHSRITLTDSAAPRDVLQVLERNGTGLPTPDHLEVLLA